MKNATFYTLLCTTLLSTAGKTTDKEKFINEKIAPFTQAFTTPSKIKNLRIVYGNMYERIQNKKTRGQNKNLEKAKLQKQVQSSTESLEKEKKKIQNLLTKLRIRKGEKNILKQREEKLIEETKTLKKRIDAYNNAANIQVKELLELSEELCDTENELEKTQNELKETKSNEETLRSKLKNSEEIRKKFMNEVEEISKTPKKITKNGNDPKMNPPVFDLTYLIDLNDRDNNQNPF